MKIQKKEKVMEPKKIEVKVVAIGETENRDISGSISNTPSVVKMIIQHTELWETDNGTKAQRGHIVNNRPNEDAKVKKIHEQHFVNKCENLDNDQIPKKMIYMCNLPKLTQVKL